MAFVRLKQGEMLNNLAVVEISDKVYKSGLSLLAEAWRPLELARKYGKMLRFVPNSGRLITEVEGLKARLAFKSLKGVKDAIKKIMKMKNETMTEAEKLKSIVEEVEILKK